MNKKDLGLDMMKTLLMLYETQENIKITCTITDKENSYTYLYKNGTLYKK